MSSTLRVNVICLGLDQTHQSGKGDGLSLAQTFSTNGIMS